MQCIMHHSTTCWKKDVLGQAALLALSLLFGARALVELPIHIPGGVGCQQNAYFLARASNFGLALLGNLLADPQIALA